MELGMGIGNGGVWFVYLLRCGDGSLYTGIARDVPARVAQHAAGKGARYTRGRGPLELCATRRCKSKGEALKLEHAIKQLPRPQKEAFARARRIRLKPKPSPSSA